MVFFALQPLFIKFINNNEENRKSQCNLISSWKLTSLTMPTAKQLRWWRLDAVSGQCCVLCNCTLCDQQQQKKKENGHRFVQINVGRALRLKPGPFRIHVNIERWLIRICNRFCIYFIASPTLISSISKKQQQYHCQYSSSLSNRYGYRFLSITRTSTHQNFTMAGSVFNAVQCSWWFRCVFS